MSTTIWAAASSREVWRDRVPSGCTLQENSTLYPNVDQRPKNDAWRMSRSGGGCPLMDLKSIAFAIPPLPEGRQDSNLQSVYAQTVRIRQQWVIGLREQTPSVRVRAAYVMLYH